MPFFALYKSTVVVVYTLNVFSTSLSFSKTLHISSYKQLPHPRLALTASGVWARTVHGLLYFRCVGHGPWFNYKRFRVILFSLFISSDVFLLMYCFSSCYCCSIMITVDYVSVMYLNQLIDLQ